MSEDPNDMVDYSPIPDYDESEPEEGEAPRTPKPATPKPATPKPATPVQVSHPQPSPVKAKTSPAKEPPTTVTETAAPTTPADVAVVPQPKAPVPVFDFTPDPELEEQTKLLATLAGIENRINTMEGAFSKAFSQCSAKMNHIVNAVKVTNTVVAQQQQAIEQLKQDIRNNVPAITAGPSVPAITYHPQPFFGTGSVLPENETWSSYYAKIFNSSIPDLIYAKKMAYIMLYAGLNTVSGEVVMYPYPSNVPSKEPGPTWVCLHTRLLMVLIQLKFHAHFPNTQPLHTAEKKKGSSNDRQDGDKRTLIERIKIAMQTLGWVCPGSNWEAIVNYIEPHLGFRRYVHASSEKDCYMVMSEDQMKDLVHATMEWASTCKELPVSSYKGSFEVYFNTHIEVVEEDQTVTWKLIENQEKLSYKLRSQKHSRGTLRPFQDKFNVIMRKMEKKGFTADLAEEDEDKYNELYAELVDRFYKETKTMPNFTKPGWATRWMVENFSNPLFYRFLSAIHPGFAEVIKELSIGPSVKSKHDTQPAHIRNMLIIPPTDDALELLNELMKDPDAPDPSDKQKKRKTVEPVLQMVDHFLQLRYQKPGFLIEPEWSVANTSTPKRRAKTTKRKRDSDEELESETPRLTPSKNPEKPKTTSRKTGHRSKKPKLPTPEPSASSESSEDDKEAPSPAPEPSKKTASVSFAAQTKRADESDPESEEDAEPAQHPSHHMLLHKMQQGPPQFHPRNPVTKAKHDEIIAKQRKTNKPETNV